MLVISRKKDESIILEDKLGQEIIVSVERIRGRIVNLGIEAPIETPVHRKEVYDKIKSENLYNKFRVFLSEKNYEGAFKIFESFKLHDKYLPTHDEITELEKGLGRKLIEGEKII